MGKFKRTQGVNKLLWWTSKIFETKQVMIVCWIRCTSCVDSIHCRYVLNQISYSVVQFLKNTISTLTPLVFRTFLKKKIDIRRVHIRVRTYDSYSTMNRSWLQTVVSLTTCPTYMYRYFITSFFSVGRVIFLKRMIRFHEQLFSLLTEMSRKTRRYHH